MSLVHPDSVSVKQWYVFGLRKDCSDPEGHRVNTYFQASFYTAAEARDFIFDNVGKFKWQEMVNIKALQ